MLTTLPPLEGVRETELMTTAKDRMDVPGGGVKGSAASVIFSEAFPLTGPQLTVHLVLTPLQEVRERERSAATATAKTDFFEFMSKYPKTELDATPGGQGELDFSPLHSTPWVSPK